jgi:hypothetical protein
MLVLGSCWHRPIFGKIKEVLKELEQHWKIGEHAGNKGKATPKKEEKEAPRKEVTKCKNCCRVVGKWNSTELEQLLGQGMVEIKSRRKWTNLIRLGSGFL